MSLPFGDKQGPDKGLRKSLKKNIKYEQKKESNGGQISCTKSTRGTRLLVFD